MYSDHYRLKAHHVDGASRRRFRIRPKWTTRKPNMTGEQTVVPKDPNQLLELLAQSCTEAERVALTTGLERHQRHAQTARGQLEQYQQFMWLHHQSEAHVMVYTNSQLLAPTKTPIEGARR